MPFGYQQGVAGGHGVPVADDHGRGVFVDHPRGRQGAERTGFGTDLANCCHALLYNYIIALALNKAIQQRL